MKESLRIAIRTPELGSPRVRLSLWHVRVGDRVTEGDRVAELLVPGATFDVSAPATGVLAEQLAKPNDTLIPQAILGTIVCDEN